MSTVALKKNSAVYALVDCNNFYASCERVFNPLLQDKPVVVLSNNDGIIVARSQEVKRMGVAMGTPYFKAKKLFTSDVNVFSSNYELYGDMSHRVMSILKDFTDDIEFYSIDEAFLRLDRLQTKDYTALSREIRDKVYRWTGIPVSVGVASTKTLAKAANEVAKKYSHCNGVTDFTGLSEIEVDEFLTKLDIEDVWGIGRQYSKMLRSHGVEDALGFKNLFPAFVQKKMTVTGLRTQMELHGISCLPLEMILAPKKGIVCSRSFGRLVTPKKDLAEAVSTHISRACEKLRSQKSKARRLEVFIRTNFFREQDKQYFTSKHTYLPISSDYTPEFIRAGMSLLNSVYREGYSYYKAGVFLSDISPGNIGQKSLFHPALVDNKRYMSTIVDRTNSKYGSRTIFYASEGIAEPWKIKREKISKKYTTCWDELPEVH